MALLTSGLSNKSGFALILAVTILLAKDFSTTNILVGASIFCNGGDC